ncbi:MAG: F0F1 ATP synthase subunit B, partial [Micrococcales bacterium]|nr:F0F1 ATP synthase subunit B [Micrococcales bacterium]
MHSAFVTAVKTAEAPINPLLPATADLVWGGIIFAGILVFFIGY